MCGIFGISINNNSNFTRDSFNSTVNSLFTLSESRGKEAAGLATLSDSSMHVYKRSVSASLMIRSREYKKAFNKIGDTYILGKNGNLMQPVTAIGHSRLATKGMQSNRHNNQPIITSGVVGVHNGIVVNDEDLWKRFPSMQRKCEVDSEVIFSLIYTLYKEQSLIEVVKTVFSLIEGVASIAVLFNDINYMLLATNNGSLYYCTNKAGNTFIFASEDYILRTLMKKRYLRNLLGQYSISHLKPCYACLVNVQNLNVENFSLKKEEENNLVIQRNSSSRNLVDILPENKGEVGYNQISAEGKNIGPSINKSLFCHTNSLAPILKRCRKCILPSTMPFIEFDDEGICNYCRIYNKVEPKGVDTLEKIVGKYRRNSGKSDCLVGISGGRDSTYGLHYIKKVLKMNPIAYTYDWGMVTDIARRNISRICGKLGIEHLLVSADIMKKREFIKMNIEAWLKKPDLGMIPLFMAGDKMYFYYANKLKKQVGVDVVFLCENMLERTHFKSGFSGIKPECRDEDHVYTLSLTNKIRLSAYYCKQYLNNSLYLNRSLFDTVSAYACYYLISRNYLNLYRFIQWDEKEILSVLVNEYGWESASDTKMTWRIGDGTAPFYNYLYYKLAGFTENDTFRSNQVRENILTREEALKIVEEENKPRYEPIKQYLQSVGLNYDSVMQRIEEISKIRWGCNKK